MGSEMLVRLFFTSHYLVFHVSEIAEYFVSISWPLLPDKQSSLITVDCYR